MSNFTQIKQQIGAYIRRLKTDKSELFKMGGLALLAIYLTIKFLGSFDSTIGYDIRGEFSGCLILVSFFSFLFIAHKTENEGLKLLSFCHVLICLINFLILKSLTTLFLLKLVTAFAAIFLLLVILREIKNQG